MRSELCVTHIVEVGLLVPGEALGKESCSEREWRACADLDQSGRAVQGCTGLHACWWVQSHAGMTLTDAWCVHSLKT